MSDQRNRPGFVVLTSHWLTRLGMAIGITTVIAWLFFVPSELHGGLENPYKGAILYLILPAVLVFAIVLAVVGIWLKRRQIREHLASGVDKRTALYRLTAFLAITIGVNLLIGTQLTFKAVEYMDTPQFCGTKCHSMKPEFMGHQSSQHASVACAECHIAPGVGGFVKAKMNGTRQLWHTVTNNTEKPVKSALESGMLVPSKETCQRCHWTDKIVGSRLVVVPTYASDEKNSETYTVLMMLVGGSAMKGIHHDHFAGGYEMRYAATDAKRQTIPWVERRNTKTGETDVYLAKDAKPEDLARLEKRDMQCVDCHNRPTHTFSPADRALNRAMAAGAVPATLPFIKKQGLAALQATYASSDAAAQKIPAAIEAYYRESHPQVYAARKADVTKASLGVLDVYSHNVFPELKVTWGTYPNDLGHTDSPGCFRCHDGSHATADGKKTIGQDCASCHEVLAMDEASPQILKTLGILDQIQALNGPGLPAEPEPKPEPAAKEEPAAKKTQKR
jgi:nitrate/TMAO reductase-like tetraheme cytochrome c subunit